MTKPTSLLSSVKTVKEKKLDYAIYTQHNCIRLSEKILAIIVTKIVKKFSENYIFWPIRVISLIDSKQRKIF